MNGVGVALGGLAGSLFGSGSHGTDWSAVDPYLADLYGNAGQFTNAGLSSLSQYNSDNGAYRSALNNYADYLSQDPYTDSRDASEINTATAGLSDAYNKAQSSLSSKLAQRGMGDSSMAAGGLAGIENARAGAIAGAENTLATNAVNDHENRLKGLLSLMGGAAATDYSRGTSALNSAGGEYNSLANIGLQQSEYDQKRQDTNSNDLFGSLGSASAGLFKF